MIYNPPYTPSKIPSPQSPPPKSPHPAVSRLNLFHCTISSLSNPPSPPFSPTATSPGADENSITPASIIRRIELAFDIRVVAGEGVLSVVMDGVVDMEDGVAFENEDEDERIVVEAGCDSDGGEKSITPASMILRTELAFASSDFAGEGVLPNTVLPLVVAVLVMEPVLLLSKDGVEVEDEGVVDV